MQNNKLETNWGWDFNKTAKEAQAASNTLGVNVEFEFNTIICVVNGSTNLDLLLRDYLNAYLMDWEEVGPECYAEYPASTAAELSKRQAARDEKDRLQQIEREKERKAKAEALDNKINGVELKVTIPEKMATWENSNTDGYGAAIINYAKKWGRLMQAEMANGASLEDIAEKASHEANTEGITGYMYGAAVQVLTDTWEYGEQLRKWHNKEYNHEGDGVVNPAVLTIN